MDVIGSEVLRAIGLWTGLNLLLLLGLALRVSQLRVRLGTGVGTGDDPGLERAIRAHGNNAEYVPAALLMLLLVGATGSSATVIHVAGGALLVARALHAYGIQQIDERIPPGRAIGNVATWTILAWGGVTLVWRALP